MALARSRPYHHGRLREAVLEAALEEIEAVGTARMSMREIARRAGVSHAAPAHHFGDKAGIFTAIAAQGYRLLEEETTESEGESGALMQCGFGYVRFAMTHPAHFEVMFQPELYRQDDPDLVAAQDASFDVLFRSVQGGLGPGREDEVLACAIAGWSAVHGFATLWLAGNLLPKLEEPGAPFESVLLDMARGFVAVAEIIRQQMPSG